MGDVHRSRRRGRLAFALALASLALSACTADGEPSDDSTSTGTPGPPAPEVDVPAGVELTDAGTELAIGEPAAVVFRAGRGRVSTIEVAVTKVVKGSMRRDFTNFGLSRKQLAEHPYYVTLKVTNTGPGPLGGAAPPVWALDSTDTYFPPTSLVGHLPACPGAPLPKPFDAGDSATRCLLFIAAADSTVEQVQVRPYEGFEPVWWAVPGSVERAAQRREQRAQVRAERSEKPGKPGRR